MDWIFIPSSTLLPQKNRLHRQKARADRRQRDWHQQLAW
jgi:hypothetical protein